MMWWSVSPFAADEELATGGDTLKLGMHAPDTYRGDTAAGAGRHQAVAGGRLAHAVPHRGPRPGGPYGRGARRRGHPRPPGRRPRRDLPVRRPRLLRLPRQRLRRPVAQARRAHRDRPLRPEGGRQGRRPDAGPPPQDHRPAHPRSGRLHRARAARRGPLHRDGAAHGPGRHPRIPARRVRPRQARPARRPPLHPHRPAGAGHQVRGRRGPDPAPARRRRLDQDQGARQEGRQGDRRRPHQAVLRADGGARPHLRPGHPLAARAGGRLPVRGDPRPAHHHRRGQGGHGEVGPDGPADLRRRRLRQDRDRGPRRLQGRPGRQAGGGPGPDHPPRPAALRHLHRALRPVPGQRPGALPLPDRHRGQGRPRRAAGRLRRPRHRHPPPLLLRDQVQGPGPGHRRRGAAVRRRAQGAAEEAPRQRGCPHHVRHPHPPHPGDGGDRHPRDVHDHHPARGAPPGPDLRRAVRAEADRRRHPP